MGKYHCPSARPIRQRLTAHLTASVTEMPLAQQKKDAMAPNFSDDDFLVKRMAVTNDPKKCSVLRAAPRLLQILRVLSRHKFLGALLGSSHWPAPKEVRETFEELGLVFLKFGQVLAMRRDLLPDAYIKELEQLHDQLPAMGMDEVRATVEVELGGSVDDVVLSIQRNAAGRGHDRPGA